jgi:hypothetical protein
MFQKILTWGENFFCPQGGGFKNVSFFASGGAFLFKVVFFAASVG